MISSLSNKKATYLTILVKLAQYKRFHPIMNQISIPNKMLSTALISVKNLNFFNIMKKNFIFNYKKNITNLPQVLYVNKNGCITPSLQQNTTDALYSFPINHFHKEKLKIVTGLSGIYCPPPNFYINALTNKKICFMTLKFAYDILCKYPLKNKNDLAFRIKDFFFHTPLLNELDYYPLAQHIGSSIMALHRFPPTILNEIAPQIDFKAYMNDVITPSTIIETDVLLNSLSSMIKDHGHRLQIIAQNPDEPNGQHLFYASQAYSLMKQPHPDFRFHFLFESESNKVWFYDIKLKNDPNKTLPRLKGFLSYTTNLNKNETMIKFKADLGNAIKTQKNDEHKAMLQEELTLINTIIVNKNLTLDQKYAIFLENQNKFDLNPELPVTTICSRIVMTKQDVFFEEFLAKNPDLQLELEKIASTIDKKDFFPEKTQTSNVDMWKSLLIRIIKILPPEEKKLAIENMHKFITWEI